MSESDNKVFMVTTFDDVTEETYNVRAFSTREKAEAFLAAGNQFSVELNIEEWPVW